MTELKQRLGELFARGPAARAEIDQLLGQDGADPRADLRATFALADLARLRLLREKLYDGDVITRCYHRTAGGRHQGCVHYWLTGVDSNADLLAQEFPSEDALKAVCRSIRAWDYGTVGPDLVFEVLTEAIQDREQLNALEDAAADRAAWAAAVPVG